MTWETAKKAIDLYAKNTAGRNNMNISFYGGEPLIAFDIIKKCCICRRAVPRKRLIIQSYN